MNAWKYVAAAYVVLGGVLQGMAQEPQKPQAPGVETPAPELQPLPPEPVAGDALYAPLAVGNGPEGLKTKVDSWLVISFGPRALVSPLISSAIAMAKPNYNYPSDWLDGPQGFARQYGSKIGTKVSFQTARFATGALLHEDFRYRPSTDKDFFPRVFHAMGFAFVDQSDSGHRMLAVANFTGAAAGGFTPNLWLPDGFNDTRHGLTRTGSKFGGFVIQNELREFSPEIAKAFKAMHLPFPRLPVPEWWNKDISVARRTAP